MNPVVAEINEFPKGSPGTEGTVEAGGGGILIENFHTHRADSL